MKHKNRDFAEVPIGEIRERITYDPLTGDLTWKRKDERNVASLRATRSWNSRYAGGPALSSLTANGYFAGTFNHVHLLAHRVAWALFTGSWPKGVLDHIDRDRTNNRIINLRDADDTVNARNASLRVDNTSGVTGVTWGDRDGKWIAQINIDGRRISLGHYDTKEEAINARLLANKKYGFSSTHEAIL